MALSRIEIILILGFFAFALRALPQIFFVNGDFPARWDRLLRYLSYALLCSIISTTLFMTQGRLETAALSQRSLALIVTILVARWRKSAVTGMLVGMVLVTLLSWLR